MKLNKICPKCGSADIVKLISDKTASSGANIQLGFTSLSVVRVSKYVCCNCGFKEEWAEDEDLHKLRKSLGRIEW